MENEENEIKVLSPFEYFQGVKEKIQTMDDEKLKQAYQNAIYLAERYKKTGQKKGLRKLMFHIESITKEKQVLEAGINKFVYKSDIEDYIEDVAKNQVVILTLAQFERNLPDEIVEALEKVQNLFDEFYVVCTDYNGKMAKEVEKERREKDPILFGAFLNRDKNAINERFYYIGDWVDEYCDLTLDKMVAEMKDELGVDIVNTMLSIPESKEELIAQMDSLKLEEDENGNATKITLISSDIETSKKKNFFDKIKTFLRG